MESFFFFFWKAAFHFFEDLRSLWVQKESSFKDSSPREGIGWWRQSQGNLCWVLPFANGPNPENVGQGCESGRNCWASLPPLCVSDWSSGLFPSRFSNSVSGGRLDAALHVATLLRLLVEASCLYLDGVRRVRALLLPWPIFIFNVGCVNRPLISSLCGSKKTLRPKKVLGLEP